MPERLIFQLGTNNWQRDGEFAPGSGILHEAHHHALNSLPDVRAYSMYPSKVQRYRKEDVRVFPLEHDIPIAESISPVSSYRWHSMSEDEVAAYRKRLTDEVFDWMAEIEEGTDDRFSLAVAHHAFMNTVVLRDVNRRRMAAGRDRMTILCFTHGTELKMFNNEKRGDDPDEFPLRFLPYMQREKIFDYDDPDHGVDVVAAISEEQVEAFLGVFPEFPRERVVLSANGYNQDVFLPLPEGTDPVATLAGFDTVPAEGSDEQPGPVVAPDGVDAIVAFCGKFADWKRLDVLLRAAATYEQHEKRIMTIVIGSGPPEAQREMHDLAAELGLRRTFFLGPRAQDELAVLFGCADVGCFPSYREPFGLVFIECMACATPVIGADSGGPRDFVTPEVGMLVPETDDKDALATSLVDAVDLALREDWKQTMGPTAANYARRRFSVEGQVAHLLGAVDGLTAQPDRGMEQRISLITLGVADVARAKQFYERLGWHGQEVEETVFFQAGGMGLVLWHEDKLADDAGFDRVGVDGFRGVNVAQNVRTRDEVDDVVAAAVDAGATVTRSPAETFYGGYAGHFTDPDGHAWEIAYNPGFPLADDGTLTIPDFSAE